MIRLVTAREQAEVVQWRRAGIGDDAYTNRLNQVHQTLNSAPQHLYTHVAHAGPIDGWSVERHQQHQEILDDAWNKLGAHVPRQRQGMVLGGLPGSGKSTTLNSMNIDGVGPVKGNFMTVDPDYFKEELARRGMTPKVPGLSPMETAPLYHKESLYLAQQLSQRAYQHGTNILHDGTLRWQDAGHNKINDMERNGYTTHGAFVNIPLEMSHQRVQSRHRAEQEKYDASPGSSLGGRVVPPDLIASSQPRNPQFSSINHENFESLRPRLKTSQVWDNSGASPVRIS